MTAKPSVVVIGASGHAGVVIDILEKAGCHTIVGVLDRPGTPLDGFLGYEILGSEEDLPGLMRTRGIEGGVIAVGDNRTRADIAQRVERLVPGFSFVAAIHPAATLARDVEIGSGTVIMAGVVVNTAARIGSHCMLNTNASLDHDSVMGDFSSLAPGAATGGNVRIGEHAAVMMGVQIAQGVSVGARAVVGAGSVVLEDVPPDTVAHGTPCRPVRHRVPGDDGA